jgi:hypothetical protein
MLERLAVTVGCERGTRDRIQFNTIHGSSRVEDGYGPRTDPGGGLVAGRPHERSHGAQAAIDNPGSDLDWSPHRRHPWTKGLRCRALSRHLRRISRAVRIVFFSTVVRAEQSGINGDHEGDGDRGDSNGGQDSPKELMHD